MAFKISNRLKRSLAAAHESVPEEKRLCIEISDSLCGEKNSYRVLDLDLRADILGGCPRIGVVARESGFEVIFSIK